METLEAEFDIVTPMFLGGGDQQATRIRESSIKTALAFWWRAKNFASIYRACGNNLSGALRELQQRERFLFGGPDGTGLFQLRVETAMASADLLPPGLGHVLGNSGKIITHDNGDVVGVGARYLGYGIIAAFTTREKDKGDGHRPVTAYAGDLQRSCVAMDRKFALRVVFRKRNKAKREDAEGYRNGILDVCDALKVFGLIGGLGSRARRGWGSVALRKLTGYVEWTAPASHPAYTEELKRILGVAAPLCSGLDFPLSAFAKETRIRVWDQQPFNNGLDALNKVGEGLLRYRARGRPQGHVGAQAVDASFARDHDWFREPGTFDSDWGSYDTYVPDRAAFGLPHNYSDRVGITAGGKLDRRASPLLLHIHKIGNQFVPVAVLMPTKFLPGMIKIKTQRRSNEVSCTVQTKAVTDYLDGKKHVDKEPWTGTDQKYFPGEDIWS